MEKLPVIRRDVDIDQFDQSFLDTVDYMGFVLKSPPKLEIITEQEVHSLQNAVTQNPVAIDNTLEYVQSLERPSISLPISGINVFRKNRLIFDLVLESTGFIVEERKLITNFLKAQLAVKKLPGALEPSMTKVRFGTTRRSNNSIEVIRSKFSSVVPESITLSKLSY